MQCSAIVITNLHGAPGDTCVMRRAATLWSEELSVRMKIPSWAQNGLMSPEIRLSVVRAMKVDNWAVGEEDRVIHCECGNDKVGKVISWHINKTVGIFRDARYSFVNLLWNIPMILIWKSCAMVYHTAVASSVTGLPSRCCQKLTLSTRLILKTQKLPVK